MSGIADISSPQTFSNDLADYFCKVSWKLKENNATSRCQSMNHTNYANHANVTEFIVSNVLLKELCH